MRIFSICLLLLAWLPHAAGQTPLDRFLQQIGGRWNGTGQVAQHRGRFTLAVDPILDGKFTQIDERAPGAPALDSRSYVRGADGLLLLFMHSGAAGRGTAQLQQGVLALSMTGSQRTVRRLLQLDGPRLRLVLQASAPGGKWINVGLVHYTREPAKKSPAALELEAQQLRLQARELELRAAKLAHEAQRLRLERTAPPAKQPAPVKPVPPKEQPKQPVQWIVPRLVHTAGQGKWTGEKGALHGVGPASGFSLAYLGNPLWTDYAVEFEARVEKGSFGLFLRGLSRGAQFPNLFTVARAPADPKLWIKVRAVARGGEIQVTVSWAGQQRVIRSKNPSHTSGLFGFAVHAGTDFEVRGLRVDVRKSRAL